MEKVLADRYMSQGCGAGKHKQDFGSEKFYQCFSPTVVWNADMQSYPVVGTYCAPVSPSSATSNNGCEILQHNCRGKSTINDVLRVRTHAHITHMNVCTNQRTRIDVGGILADMIRFFHSYDLLYRVLDKRRCIPYIS